MAATGSAVAKAIRATRTTTRAAPAQQQLHVIANSMTEEESKAYLFITKARDTLQAHVP